MPTRNETDLRRARQRARRIIRSINTDIEQWIRDEGVDIWQDSTLTPRERARRTNEIISRLASERMREDLLGWLEQRRKTTSSRAARQAFQRMQETLPGAIDESAMIGSSTLGGSDAARNAVLNQIDAGVLYEDGDSIAQQLGDRVTRQIRIGFAEGEPVKSTRKDQMDLATRVKSVLRKGDQGPTGATGMSIQSRAELIAHDSVQDAYVSTSHQRYLNNGFRYARYDAVIDNKTSDVCERLNGEIIDLVEHPELKPPNHPWCRSDIIPLLEIPEDREPLTPDQVGQQHLNRIRSTNGFRPTVIDTSQEFNPTALNELMDRAG